MSLSTINEDARYRTSTQFRLWSYTPSSLLELRTTTNSLAAARVRAAVQKIREARRSASVDNTDGDESRATSAVPEGEVDCLTVEEELRLLKFYCLQTAQLSDHLKMPKDVKSTAIQYMKRFYTTNSLMTYHPTTILKTALFFATKTENHYTSLHRFCSQIGKTTPEDVLASEFLLTQGLRFTFDVRHPYRALEGAVMELLTFAKQDIPLLPPSSATSEPGEKPYDLERRVKNAHLLAKEYLKTSALLTDAYFHYTPSQIMFSSLLLADKEITLFYLSTKFPSDAHSQSLHQKVLQTIQNCSRMLSTVDPQEQTSPEEKKELQVLSKKLKKCRNPEKMDLVALQRAKREGDEVVDEKVIKKRKMEREKVAKEADDLFGPEIKREK